MNSDLFELLLMISQARPPHGAMPTHEHYCESCHHTFIHGEECAGSREAHMCPRCGRGPWWFRTEERNVHD